MKRFTTLSTRRGRFLSVILISSVLFIQSCDLLDTDSDDNGEDGEDVLLVISEEPENTIHDDFLLVSNQIADFAGFYFDLDGNPNVMLLNPDQGRLNEVRQALENILGDDILSRGDSPRRPVPSPQLLFRQAEYQFTALLSWFNELDEVLDIEEVSFTDIDEELNRIVIGVVTLGASNDVFEALSRTEIPMEAIELVEEDFDEMFTTLRDEIRPLKGGIQIQRQGGGTCTLGIPARHGGRSGFITNSHCTAEFGNVTGSIFGSPRASDRIGVEVHDPAPYPCGFLNRRRCRMADAAFVESDQGMLHWNAVARTLAWGAPGDGAATLDRNMSNPRLAIRGTKRYPIRGEMVDKVGRTTGWTYGFVRRTCSNRNPHLGGEPIRFDGRRVRLDCQQVATYHSASGDSGSPVFFWHGDEITIYGINWGVTNNRALFSAWGRLWQ